MTVIGDKSQYLLIDSEVYIIQKTPTQTWLLLVGVVEKGSLKRYRFAGNVLSMEATVTHKSVEYISPFQTVRATDFEIVYTTE